MKTLFYCMLVLLCSNPALAAYTSVSNNSAVFSIGNLFNSNIVSQTSFTNDGTPYWLSTDLGLNTLLGSVSLYIGSSGAFPASLTVQVSPDIATTFDLSNSATWTTVKTLTGISTPPSTVMTVGFDSPVYARSVRFLFDSVPSDGFSTIGEISYSAVIQATSTVLTADTFATLESIKADTLLIKSLVSSGGGGMTPEQFDMLITALYTILGIGGALVFATTWKG